jgi:hypothetical protein
LQSALYHLECVMPRLERIADLHEELRDCVGAADARTREQRHWLLQHRADEIRARLVAAEAGTEAEAKAADDFEARCRRFVDWAQQAQRRITEDEDEQPEEGKKKKVRSLLNLGKLRFFTIRER